MKEKCSKDCACWCKILTSSHTLCNGFWRRLLQSSVQLIIKKNHLHLGRLLSCGERERSRNNHKYVEISSRGERGFFMLNETSIAGCWNTTGKFSSNTTMHDASQIWLTPWTRQSCKLPSLIDNLLGGCRYEVYSFMCLSYILSFVFC